MTTATRNEAAERLDHLIARWSASATKASLRAALDEALAAERRATVERIRERIDAYSFDQGDHEFGWKNSVRAILDEEAAVWLADPPTWEFGDDPDVHETCGYVWEVHDNKLLPPDGVATPFGCPWSEQEAIERWGPR